MYIPQSSPINKFPGSHGRSLLAPASSRREVRPETLNKSPRPNVDSTRENGDLSRENCDLTRENVGLIPWQFNIAMVQKGPNIVRLSHF